MNIKENQTAELKLAIRKAENIARKRSGKAWFMANILIPKPGRNYLFLCYAYLRWVDNFIDDTARNYYEKTDFIENQLELINLISSQKKPGLKSPEEKFLYYFILFALQNNKTVLIDELKNMIEALHMDVQRLSNGGVFSEKELHCYITMLNKSMFGLVNSFMFFDQRDNIDCENLGELLWYAGTLRDFYEDHNEGFINISREEIEKYKLSFNNPDSDDKIRVWLKDKIPNILNLLDQEISILKKMQFKIRLFWSFAYPFYLHKILRIKMYDFSFSYKQKINFIKELKASIAAIKTGFSAILKILI